MLVVTLSLVDCHSPAGNLTPFYTQSTRPASLHSLSNMQTTFALAALAAMAYAVPQGVSGDIAPSAPAPEGCSADYPGTFQITAVNSKVVKRDIYKVGWNPA